MAKKLFKFQMGGEMMPPEGAPMEGDAPMEPGMEQGAPAGGEDPVMQLVQLAMQALEAQDPQMAMSVCEGLVSLVQGAGGAPAPEGAPEEPVMMKKGGKVVCKKGAKLRKKC